MIEIERKFLVLSSGCGFSGGTAISQWYVMRSEGRSLRVRQKGDHYVLTLKVGKGAVRQEIERSLEPEEARGLIVTALDAPIVKTRFKVPVGRHVWDVDVFGGENEGLVLAEVELNDPDEFFERPKWLGLEVTGDPRFQNASLAETPISRWRKDFEALAAR